MRHSNEDYRSMALEDLLNELCNFTLYNIEDFKKLSDYVTAKQDEYMALRILNLTQNLTLTNKQIKNLKDSLDANTKKIIESNDNFSKSQGKYQCILSVLTCCLFLATLLQAWTIYWTSKPERTIEMHQALNEWSDSIKNQKVAK